MTKSTAPKALTVEKALIVLDKGGEVAVVYGTGRNFIGRYDASSEADVAAIFALAETVDGGTVLDWVTGENFS